MIFSLLFGILLGAFTVVFALQNTNSVSVKFFAWQLDGSLALILMASVLMGGVIALLLILPESIVNYFKYKRLIKENASLTDELQKQKELTLLAQENRVTEIK